jgi:choloylglycine hydrolase
MKYYIYILTTYFFFLNHLTNACTGITISASDSTIVCARTMEFAINLESSIIVVPRDYQYQGTAPGLKPGKIWTTKYSTIGANIMSVDCLIEGLNEKGLGMGGFFHSGYADYQPVSDNDFSNTIGSWEVVSYILSNFSTTEEAVEGLKEIKVANVKRIEMGNNIVPLHYKIQDASGRCVVIEYLKGKMYVYENTIGVITNNPTFDWQLLNLSNYINLSPINKAQNDIGQCIIHQMGQGTGLLGLPGDFTPSSRFIRAVFLSQCALKPATADEAVNTAFHVLNSFDIIKGLVIDTTNSDNPYEQTQWTSAYDLKNLRFFMRTYDNPKIKMVELKKADLSSGKVIMYDMSGKNFFEDMSN